MGDSNEDITVTAYSPRYLAAFDALIDAEGGYVNDPKDRGGATKYGVSLRFLKAEGAFDEDGDGFAEFDLDMDGDIDGIDISKLTLADAKTVYAKFFWTRSDAERLARPLGEMVFDQAVNGGLMSARKLLQRALNTCLANVTNAADRPPLLHIDGMLGGGPVQHALDWVLRRPGLGMPSLVIAYRHAAEDRYREIAQRNPSQMRFLNGWVRRAQNLGRWAQ
ncbi:MAG: glycosyl hydrolase 108 family protein [Novosphingobium sp.]|uniref:glycoside hydrolase family 108 protein n=1 Tax=Novosphingobium sp. TaxID=1874826 RepID=UPI0032BA1AD6